MMGYKNREVEIKLLVEGISSMKTVNNHLEKMFPDPEDLIVARSKDVYFKTSKASKADFGRVRYFPGKSGGQMTIKSSDKGDNVDRVEIDVEVDDCDQAVEFLTGFSGYEPVGTLTKRYIVYFLDRRDTTVSLYQISGDSRVYVEVEARTREKVDKLVKEIREVIPFTLNEVNLSLYQIFIEGKDK